MEFWQALILGLVEGFTEYLPVSSTGHLLVTQRLLGIRAGEAANTYAIVVQAGAIAAVLGLYRRRVAQMALGVMGREPTGARIALALLVAFLPAAAAGLSLGHLVEQHLFRPWPIVVAWAMGGLLILIVAPRLRLQGGTSIESITWRAALIIGLLQCTALWPGVSRSLATILGGVAAGLSLAAAVEFSFLLGVVTLGAATAYKTLTSGSTMLEAYGTTELLAGFLVAWLAALVSVKWMLAWLKNRGLGIFGWWRLGAAVIVATLIVAGALDGGISATQTDLPPRETAGPRQVHRGAMPDHPDLAPRTTSRNDQAVASPTTGREVKPPPHQSDGHQRESFES